RCDPVGDREHRQLAAPRRVRARALKAISRVIIIEGALPMPAHNVQALKPPHAIAMQLASAYQVSRAVHAVTQLGVPELLGAGARRLVEMSQATAHRPIGCIGCCGRWRPSMS